MARVSHICARHLALLCALALSVGPAGAAAAEEEPLDPGPAAQLRRRPDRRPDPRRPLRHLHRLPRRAGDAGDAEHARPDRQARQDLQPLLRLLPPLLSLAGQPADRPLLPQQRRQGQRAAERRLLRLLLPAACLHNLATWLQGAGYRTIHIGKFLNGYGDEPYDDGTTCRPAGAPGTRC